MQCISDFMNQLLALLREDEALSGVSVEPEWSGTAARPPLGRPVLTVGLSRLESRRDTLGSYRGRLQESEQALYAPLWHLQVTLELYEPAGGADSTLPDKILAALSHAPVSLTELRAGPQSYDKATGALLRVIEGQAALLLSTQEPAQ